MFRQQPSKKIKPASLLKKAQIQLKQVNKDIILYAKIINGKSEDIELSSSTPECDSQQVRNNWALKGKNQSIVFEDPSLSLKNCEEKKKQLIETIINLKKTKTQNNIETTLQSPGITLHYLPKEQEAIHTKAKEKVRGTATKKLLIAELEEKRKEAEMQAMETIKAPSIKKSQNTIVKDEAPLVQNNDKGGKKTSEAGQKNLKPKSWRHSLVVFPTFSKNPENTSNSGEKKEQVTKHSRRSMSFSSSNTFNSAKNKPISIKASTSNPLDLTATWNKGSAKMGRGAEKFGSFFTQIAGAATEVVGELLTEVADVPKLGETQTTEKTSNKTTSNVSASTQAKMMGYGK
jgi:hypothetical protein